MGTGGTGKGRIPSFHTTAFIPAHMHRVNTALLIAFGIAATNPYAAVPIVPHRIRYDLK